MPKSLAKIESIPIKPIHKLNNVPSINTLEVNKIKFQNLSYHKLINYYPRLTLIFKLKREENLSKTLV